jgi:hypothetical protein
MNKFGLLDDSADSSRLTSIGDKLAEFPPVRPRGAIDLIAVDSAAAQHGFVSRESSASQETRVMGRRRRAVPSEPTRHLAIRLNESAYDRFVAFADRHKLTYHEALIRLMELAEG